MQIQRLVCLSLAAHSCAALGKLLFRASLALRTLRVDAVPHGFSLAEVAASYGEGDTNGDGILSCNGVYWLDTGSWVGSCD